MRTKGRAVATGIEASTKHMLTGSEHCSKHFTSINLGSSQLPSEVGTVVTPLEIKKGGPREVPEAHSWEGAKLGFEPRQYVPASVL